MPSNALKRTPETADPPQAAHAANSHSPKPRKKSLVRSVARWVRRGVAENSGEHSIKDTLEEILDEQPETSSELPPEERALLKNVLSFGETTAHDIMVPRSDIVAVPFDIDLAALKKHILEHRHTRIPVFEENLDSVKGFLHVKDLLPMLAEDIPFDTSSVLRDILFVPPSMRVLDLLRKMRLSGSHMAIVVDEHGGTDGLVTLENIFEEIVGDIQDEHDHEERLRRKFAWTAAGTADMDARAPVENVEGNLEVSLRTHHRTEDFDTIGGLIFTHVKRIPARGERIDHPSGVRFEILDADVRRIRRVRLYRPTPAT